MNRCVLLLAALSLLPSRLPALRQEPTGADVDSIVLVRGPCFNICPQYRVRLSAAGAIRFDYVADSAGSEVRRIGSATTSRKSVADLVRLAKQVRFFELPATIQLDSSLCPSLATDFPAANVGIYARGGAKKVDHYFGCFDQRDEARKTIAGLHRLEGAIDSVAGVSRWRVARFTLPGGLLPTSPGFPAQSAVVVIGSGTPGTVAYVNGVARDSVSSVKRIVVPAGEIRLSIRKDGCVPWDTVITALPGRQTVIGRRNPTCH